MPLSRYQSSVLDNVPRPVPGALIYVYLQPTTPNPITADNWSPSAAPLASIYEDSAGTTPLANPFAADGNGNYFFYAAANLYTVVETGETLAQPNVSIDQNLGAFVAGVTLETNGTPNSTQTLLNITASGGISVAEAAGTLTITGTAVPILLQTNGVNNSTQIKQNLVQGSGITIVESSGNVTISAASGATFETNGTPNGSQSLLNLKNGVHATVVDDGVGGITIDSAYPIFQANGTPLTSSGTVNFQNGTGILVTNPSAGVVSIALAGGSVTQQNQITLSSAQLLALKTTPISVVAAPGAGFQNVILDVVVEFVPNTTPYATVSTSDLAVYVDSTKATQFTGDSTGLLDQTAKTFELLSSSNDKFITTDAHSTNQPIMIANVGAANYTAGDGTAVVTVNYCVISVV